MLTLSANSTPVLWLLSLQKRPGAAGTLFFPHPRDDARNRVPKPRALPTGTQFRDRPHHFPRQPHWLAHLARLALDHPDRLVLPAAQEQVQEHSRPLLLDAGGLLFLDAFLVGYGFGGGPAFPEVEVFAHEVRA